MPTPLPTPLPPTSSQPVTAPETEFRADEGPLGALQTSIRNVAYTLWELSLCAQDVHPPRPEDGPHGRVARKIDEFVLQLAELDGLKDTLRMNIPLEVLQNVDATRNPHLVTKERIERAAGENQFVSGKLDALQSYHELLSASLKENFPELAPLMSGE